MGGQLACYSPEVNRRGDLFLASRTNLRAWFHFHAWVACIIDTTGNRLPKKSFDCDWKCVVPRLRLGEP